MKVNSTVFQNFDGSRHKTAGVMLAYCCILNPQGALLALDLTFKVGHSIVGRDDYVKRRGCITC